MAKNNKKTLIFIDDSGDPGFKGATGNYFVISAILMDSSIGPSLSEMVDKFRRSRNFDSKYELKFHKLRKDIIAKLLDSLVKYNLEIYAVYVDKNDFSLESITDKTKSLYNWAIKEVLRDIALEKTKICIDGKSGKRYMRETITYLRNNIKRGTESSLRIKFDDSARNNLLQLADLVAGSIHRYLEGNKTDSGTYIKILRPKIISIRRL